MPLKDDDEKSIQAGMKALFGTNIKLEFQLGQNVKIKELGLYGVIKSIWITKTGIQYQVRYFWEYKAEEVYFYADELEHIK